MKKIIVLFAIISIMLGCATQQPLRYVNRIKSTHGIDFTEYSAKGFFITPEKYQGDYDPVGLLRFAISPEAVLEKLTIPERVGSMMLVQRYKWKIEEINYAEVLEFAYDTSIEMGGDAITDFNIDYDTNYLVNTEGYPDLDLPSYVITGFVIKRK